MPVKKKASEKLKTLKPSVKGEKNSLKWSGKFQFIPPEKMEQPSKKEGIKVRLARCRISKYILGSCRRLGF